MPVERVGLKAVFDAETGELVGAMRLSAKEGKRLEHQLDRTGRSGRTAGRGLDRYSRRAEKSARSSRRAARQGNSLAASLGGVRGALAALGGTFAVREIVRAGNAMEGYENRLRTVVGSQQAVNREIAFVRREAERLGLSLDPLLDQYTKLTAASRGTALAGQPVRDIFSAIAENARVMNLTAEDTRGALNAVVQIMSKGTVQAEELRGQLGDRIPGAFNIAARSMDLTTEELGKQLKLGNITAERMLPALARGLREQASAGLEAARNSPAAEFARLRTSVFELSAEVAQSGVLSLLAAGASELSNQLTSANGAVAEARRGWALWTGQIQDTRGALDLAERDVDGIGAAFKRSFAFVRDAIVELPVNIRAGFAIIIGEADKLRISLVAAFQRWLVRARVIWQQLGNAAAAAAQFVQRVWAKTTDAVKNLLIGALNKASQVTEALGLDTLTRQYLEAAVALKRTANAENEVKDAIAKRQREHERALAALEKEDRQIRETAQTRIAAADDAIQTALDQREAILGASRAQRAFNAEFQRTQEFIQDLLGVESERADALRAQAKAQRAFNSEFEATQEFIQDNLEFQRQQRESDRELIEGMREELKLLRMTSDERAIAVNLRKLSSEATDEQRQAVIRLTKSMLEQRDANAAAREEQKKLREQANPFAKAWERGIERMDDAGQEFWRNFLEDGKLKLSNIKDIFLDVLSEMIHAATTRKILLSVGLSGGGIGTAAAAGPGGGIGGIFSSLGQGLRSLFGGGGFAGSESAIFGPGGDAIGLAGGGTSLSSALGSAGLAFGAGSLFSSLTGFGSSTGTGLGAGIGALAGSFIPGIGNVVGGLVGGALGSVVSEIFGGGAPEVRFGTGSASDRFSEFRGTTALGTVGFGDANFEDAKTQQLVQALQQIDSRIARVGAAIGPDVAAQLEENADGFVAVLRKGRISAENLVEQRFEQIVRGFDEQTGTRQVTPPPRRGSGRGLDQLELSDRFAREVPTFDRSFSSFVFSAGDLDAQLQRFQQLLQVRQSERDGAGLLGPDAAFGDVIDVLRDFTAEGENVAQVYQTLLTSTQQFEQALELLGAEFQGTREAMVRQAGEMAEAAGGVDRLSQLWSGFFETFFTQEERLAQRRQDVREAAGQELADVGLDLNVGREQFRKLFEAAMAGDLAPEARVEWLEAAEALGVVLDMEQQLAQQRRREAEATAQRLRELGGLLSQTRGATAELEGRSLEAEIRRINDAQREQIRRAEALGASEAQLAEVRRLGELRIEAAIAAQRRRIAQQRVGLADQLAELRLSEFGQELRRISQERERAIQTARQLARAAGNAAAAEADLARIEEIAAIQRANAIAALRSSTESLVDRLFGADAEQRSRELVEQQVQGTERVRRANEDRYRAEREAIRQIRGFLDNLLLDESVTTLTPRERLQEAERQFRETLERARGGDPEAAGQLTDRGRTFLEIARDMFASSERFTNVFEFVTGALRNFAERDLPDAPTGGAGVARPRPTGAGTRETQPQPGRQPGLDAAAERQSAQQLAQQLGELAQATGTSVLELASELGVPLSGLADKLGIELQDLTVETTLQLTQLSRTLGTDLTTLADEVGFSLGELGEQNSLIQRALGNTIEDLPAGIRSRLTPAFDALRSATDAASARSAVQTLQEITGELPAQFRNKLAPFFEGVDTVSLMSSQLTVQEVQRDVLIDIRALLGGAGVIGGQKPGGPPEKVGQQTSAPANSLLGVLGGIAQDVAAMREVVAPATKQAGGTQSQQVDQQQRNEIAREELRRRRERREEVDRINDIVGPLDPTGALSAASQAAGIAADTAQASGDAQRSANTELAEIIERADQGLLDLPRRVRLPVEPPAPAPSIDERRDRERDRRERAELNAALLREIKELRDEVAGLKKTVGEPIQSAISDQTDTLTRTK